MPTCFVVMPFCDTRHQKGGNEVTISAAQWDHIYERWIKRAVESAEDGYVCTRSPALPGNFVKGIVQDLAVDDLVIADLTGQRPNVYYELGIRHALRVGTVIITQDFLSVPSDLKSYYAFEYRYSANDYEYERLYNDFEKHLHKLLKAMGETREFSDSPVSDFLGIKHRLMERTLEEEKRELEYIISALKDQWARNAGIARVFKSWLSGKMDEGIDSFPILDIFPIETLYSRLISFPWRLIGYDLIKSTGNHISEFRKQILLLDRQLVKIDTTGTADENTKGLVHSLCDSIIKAAERLDKDFQTIVDAIKSAKVEVNAHLKTKAPDGAVR